MERYVLQLDNNNTIKFWNLTKLVGKLEWLESHNKNYTKTQYYKIQECLELAKEQHTLEQERLKKECLF